LSCARTLLTSRSTTVVRKPVNRLRSTKNRNQKSDSGISDSLRNAKAPVESG
jgi:hypothetical protein